jgi:nicotinamide riboside kinase
MSVPENVRANVVTFVGAGCVGKTTLLQACQAKYGNLKGVEFVPEAARVFFTDNPMSEEERFLVQAQGQIQAMAIAAQSQASSTNKLVFADRACLDAAVYVAANGDEAGGLELLDRARPWLPMYLRIFLLDPEGIPFEQDEVRKEAEEVRQRFHHAFANFFQDNSVPYALLSGSLEERMRQVDDVVAPLI